MYVCLQHFAHTCTMWACARQGSKDLKKSQVYTHQFGMAVTKLVADAPGQVYVCN
jgi:hypothetical protein